MPQNPFTDVWKFLTGATNDYLNLGAWRYLLVVLFLLLIAASVMIAVRNWREDPAQRTGTHLGTWFVRVLIGCMWFEAMLWKLPLPVGGGLAYWTEQMGQRAAFKIHREFVTGFLIPNLHLFGPFVFLAELAFTVSFDSRPRRAASRRARDPVRPAPLARHLSARQSGGVVVVVYLSHRSDVPVHALCRRPQPRARCLAAP